MISKLKDILLGAFVCLLLLLPYTYFLTDTFEENPNPYTTYWATYTTENDGRDFVLVVGFDKYGCEFRRLEVFGKYAGEWFLIPWENTLGEASVVGDRLKGEHTLRITASPIERDYDSIQIRTRHACLDEGEVVLVDKVLWTFYLTNTKIMRLPYE